MEFVGLKDRVHFHKKYLRPLLEQEKIKMTISEKPQSKNQKYRTKETIK
ncbi:Fic family protein [Porphyromonas gingivalis]